MASPVYRSSDPDAPIRLVAVGDSTAFTGPNGPLIPDEPLLYPNVAGRAIADELGREVAVTVFAHPGAGVRETWYALTRDRHAMFEVIMRADALILGIGSFDHAPAGVPPWVEALVPFVRPYGMRRLVRSALRSIHPWGIAATGGMAARVPAREFERLYAGILFQLRSLSWGAPSVALGPTSHRSPYYGWVHPQHGRRVALERAIAERNEIAFVESWPLVEPYAEKLNSDGIHWPFEAHDAVGRALATALLPQIRGEQPTPSIPWDGAPA